MAVLKLSLAQPSLIHIGKFLMQQLPTTQNSKFTLQLSLVVLSSEAQSKTCESRSMPLAVLKQLCTLNVQ